MDMWISYARRRRPCITCTKPIEPGDQVMVGQWKRTGSYGTRTRRTMSHFECWVTKARVWFDDNGYKPVFPISPGRPVEFTPEQKRRRNALGVKIHKNRKKQQEYTGQGMWVMAEKYADVIREAREELEEMVR